MAAGGDRHGKRRRSHLLETALLSSGLWSLVSGLWSLVSGLWLAPAEDKTRGRAGERSRTYSMTVAFFLLHGM